MKTLPTKQRPTVKVEWDPLPDVDGGNQTEETDQVLLPTYWRKEIAGAWRMDVDLELATSDNITEPRDDSEASIIWESSRQGVSLSPRQHTFLERGRAAMQGASDKSFHSFFVYKH